VSTDDRFAEFRKNQPYHIVHISEDRLELLGGGDFYDKNNRVPDEETTKEAEKYAMQFGKRIIRAEGEWQGYSEYTPEPGDVSVFHWTDTRR